MCGRFHEGIVGSSLGSHNVGYHRVNPLSPHYHTLIVIDMILIPRRDGKFAGMAGCDMPDKIAGLGNRLRTASIFHLNLPRL